MPPVGWWLAAALLLAAFPAAAPAPQPCPDPVGVERLLCGGRLDLNAASPAELEVIPGIGPRRARALAEARPFGSLDDVVRVHGFGPVSVDRIRRFAEVLP